MCCVVIVTGYDSEVNDMVLNSKICIDSCEKGSLAMNNDMLCVWTRTRSPEREDFYFDGMQRIWVKCVTALCIRDFQFRFSYYLSPAGMSGGISWQISAE